MSHARRWLARATVAALVLYVVAVGALLVEVQLARSGTRLPDERLELDGRVGAATGDALRIVWLGDSTAAGVGASGPATSVPQAVAAGLGRPVDLTVLAISGARVGDVLAEQLPRLLALPGEAPDVIAISIGANDVTHLSSSQSFREQYAAVLDGLPASTRVVLLGVPDMGSIPRFLQPLRAIAGRSGARLDAVVQSLAAERGLEHVDIAGTTGPSFRSDPGRYYAVDRFHPSDAGYALWADAVLAVLR